LIERMMLKVSAFDVGWFALAPGRVGGGRAFMGCLLLKPENNRHVHDRGDWLAVAGRWFEFPAADSF